MRINIIGAGPTGISIAWELCKIPGMNIHIYDKKPDIGGSWWEPTLRERNLHSHRAIFKNAFVNTQQLFKEMGINWSDLFEDVHENFLTTVLQHLHFYDYLSLLYHWIGFSICPSNYKKMTLKQTLYKNISKTGSQLLNALCYTFDGVPWETMTAYEFFKTLDKTWHSKMQTQKVSGFIMNNQMKNSLTRKNVLFHFNKNVVDVIYKNNSEYDLIFEDNTILSQGLCILCVDHKSALRLVKQNWGPMATHILITGMYGAINILFRFDKILDIENTLDLSIKTPWNIMCQLLDDKKTLSCVLCNITTKSPYTGLTVINTPPVYLEQEVLRQLKLKNVVKSKICWGSYWNQKEWIHDQTSGVISKHGPLPFFGKHTKVSMCGMMSYRETPFSSIEAAIEVGKLYTKLYFNPDLHVNESLHFTTVSFYILLILMLLCILFCNCR